jgi:hypothetical protein
MKKLANRGQKVNLLFKIKFHDLDKNLNKDDFITIESDAHHSDADDRQSQNETQKFMSGYRAKRKELLDCFNYLKTNEIEYEGIMQLERVENSKNWPSLTSIMGFNKGQGNGIFKKFGDTNVNAAIGTAKEIVKITKENYELAKKIYRNYFLYSGILKNDIESIIFFRSNNIKNGLFLDVGCFKGSKIDQFLNINKKLQISY